MPCKMKAALLGLVMPALFAASAMAQTDCDNAVPTITPAFLTTASLQLSQAMNTTLPDQQQNLLKQGVRMIDASTAKTNPTGRALVLGKLLAYWLNIDGTPLIANRGQIGFTSNPAGTIDMVATVDSLFRIVETEAPACVPLTTAFRRLKAWQDLVQQAMTYYNQDSLEAAKKTANRAKQLYVGLPYAHIVLGNVALRQEDYDGAVANFKEAVNQATIAAQADTAQMQNKATALYQLGNIATMALQNTRDTSKKAGYLATAKEAFEGALAMGGEWAKSAQGGLSRLSLASGDTASLRATFRDQIANPSKYSFSDLLQAGAGAADAKWDDDAIKLFTAALEMSPYHRDALFNIARLQIQHEKATEAMPYLTRLMAVDPNGADNFTLQSFVYQDLRKAVKARHDSLADQANALTKPTEIVKRKFITDTATALADSSTKLITLLMASMAGPDSLAAKVAFTEFSPGAHRAVIGGNIVNNTAASRPFTIKLEFLDKSGNVVTTQDATVTPDSRKSADFSVTGTGDGIVAFRYAKIM